MASGLKYQMSFINDFDRTVNLKIYETDFVGDVTELTPGESPITISWKGDDADIFQTMIPSEAKVNAVVEKGSGIVDDLLNMKDRQFLGLIEVPNPNIPGVYEYRWYGFLIPDNIKTNFSYLEDVLTFSIIDPITAWKGVRMFEYSSNAYQHGIHELREYLLGGNNVLEPFLDVIALFTTVNITSNISLTPDYLTDVMEDIGMFAESFNSDDGRPVTYYDGIERVCKSLFMRVYFDNATFYFIDILNFAEESFPEQTITYNQHPSTNLNNDALLLGDTEVITMIPAVNEAKCKFAFEKFNGLLINGLFNSWDDLGGDNYIIENWYPNPYLSGLADFFERRSGSGRAESPFGFLIKSTLEAISTKSLYTLKMKTSSSLTIGVQVDFETLKTISGDAYRLDKISLRVGVVAFNNNFPNNSMGLRRDYNENLVWDKVAMYDTEFRTDERWDYDYVSIGNTYPVVNPIQDVEIKVSTAVQDVNIELPPALSYLTDDDDFTIHLAIFGVYGHYVPENGWSGSIDDVVYEDLEAILSSAILNENEENETYDGEVTYVSRNNLITTKSKEREIEINTSVYNGISGALLSLISYDIGSDTFDPGYLEKVFRYGETNQMNCSLTDINAISTLWISSNPQYMIDMEVRSRLMSFRHRLNMSRLYDETKPFTDIYQEKFMTTKMDMDLKTNQHKITAVSMKVEKKPFNVGVSEPTDVYDLLEYYKY